MSSNSILLSDEILKHILNSSILESRRWMFIVIYNICRYTTTWSSQILNSELGPSLQIVSSKLLPFDFVSGHILNEFTLLLKLRGAASKVTKPCDYIEHFVLYFGTYTGNSLHNISTKFVFEGFFVRIKFSCFMFFYSLKWLWFCL